MHELLPECMADSVEANKPAAKARAKTRFQDLNTWLQCFTRYMGVLGPAKPACVSQLMSYMASQEYGLCMTMPIGARQLQQAKWQWSEVNSSLCSTRYTGKANQAGRCDGCLSAAHKSEDCILPAEDDPDVAKCLNTIQTALLALVQPGSFNAQRSFPMDTCRKFVLIEGSLGSPPPPHDI